MSILRVALPRNAKPPRLSLRLWLLVLGTGLIFSLLLFSPKVSYTSRYNDYLGTAAPTEEQVQQEAKEDALQDSQPEDASPWTAATEPAQPSEPVVPCNELPGAKDVLLVIKTGATEAEEKLPVHFKTTLTCVPDFLLFSDVEMEVQGYKVHDALDHMKDIVDRNTDEWRFKEALEAVRDSGNTSEYASMSHDEGWKLDKFKNLPMALKSYKMYPDKKWYVFIDADSGIMWSTILAFLGKFDHEKPYYMGSQVMIEEQEFAHGGSGYALSREAARKLWDEDPDAKRRHHQFAMQVCCGDLLLSHALSEVGVKLYYAFPMFQGETPTSLDYSDWHWCHPALTFHHMSSRAVELLFEYEHKVRAEGRRPPTYGDVFEAFVTPNLEDEREDWDCAHPDWADQIVIKKDGKKEDGSEPSDADRMAVESFHGCREACLERWDCMQFSWRTRRCHLSNSLRLGWYKKGTRSGWNLARMERWRKEKECKDVDWMEDKGD